MTDITQLLERAAGSDTITFSGTDVERRVQRRRRLRRTGGVLGALVVLVGGGALAASMRGGTDDALVVTNTPVTARELSGGRWVAFAFSDVMTTPPLLPHLDFTSDGKVSGYAGCNRFAAAKWSLKDERLITNGVFSTQMDCGPPFEPIEEGLVRLLGSRPLVGRFDHEPRTLQITAGDRFIAFARFDDLGHIPLPDEMVGEWTTGDGTRVTFHANNTLTVGSCGTIGRWSIRDRTLTVEGIERTETSVCSTVLESPTAKQLVEMLTTPAYVRLKGSTLYISNDGPDLVAFLQRPTGR